MKKSTQGIIGLTLIIGGAIALIFVGRSAINEIIEISTVISIPQAILIASAVIGVAIKTKKGK